MIAVGKHRIGLGGNAHAGHFRGKSRKISNFDSSNVVEIAVLVAVEANAVRRAADLPGNVADIRLKALPLCRDGFAALAVIALAKPGNKQGLKFFEARRGRFAISVSSILI